MNLRLLPVKFAYTCKRYYAFPLIKSKPAIRNNNFDRKKKQPKKSNQ